MIFGAVVNKLDIDDIFKTAEKVGSIIGVYTLFQYVGISKKEKNILF